MNSMQTKIKRHQLSQVEPAGKSEEWATKFSAYESQVGSESASEDGLFRWLPVGERTRAKRAFQAALVKAILASADLKLAKYVQISGREKLDASLITETVFRGKLIEPLLHRKPLERVASDGEIMRSRERENIVRALNYLCELAFEPQTGSDGLSAAEAERRRRMVYQSSLAYIATIVRQLFMQILALDYAGALIEKTPGENDWDEIQSGIRRLVDHPVWSAPLDETAKMRAVRDALAKNQQANKAFGEVGLKLGYVVGADKLTEDWDK